MSEDKLSILIEQMRQAAGDACAFTEGMTREEFLADRRTQQAVVMSLLILGEAASKIMDRHPERIARHAKIPWRSMRGMRNRIAHGYFEINLDVVWDTVQAALPPLVAELSRAT